MIARRKLAAQYHGSSRTTQSCLDALTRMLASSVQPAKVLLLTSKGRHGFYLDVDEPEPVFIRAGFTSGYSGEGPAGLALALHLFRQFDADVEEVVVPEKLLDDVDSGSLLEADLEFILGADLVRPIRIYDYMHDGLQGRLGAESAMPRLFPCVIPWAIVDRRIADLAARMSIEPDYAVLEAYRRLEQGIRTRCGLALGIHGVQVFKQAFRGSGALLTWPGLAPSEVEGRAQMFEAAFMAHRNPRAHREVGGGAQKAYREFYILNELFLLEAEAEG